MQVDSCKRSSFSSKMELFQGNYKIYYNAMHMVGLWPYDDSSLAKAKRIFVCTTIFVCITNQLLSIRNLDASVYEIVMLLSLMCPILCACIRYFAGVVIAFPTIKQILSRMQHDYATLKDPIEVQMLMKGSIMAERMVAFYFGLMCTGSILTILLLGVTTVLRSDAQIRCLRLIGHFYHERSLHTDLTCLLVIMTVTLGLAVFTCSEGTIAVMASNVSGLMAIVGYRIVKAIDEAKSSGRSKVLDIRPAVEMHRRAIEQVKIYTEGTMMQSLAVLIVIIVSFGVNIYRMLRAITEFEDIGNVLFSMQSFVGHVAYILGDNYSGQLMMDSGVRTIHEIYNSLWYHLPPKTQKLVLFLIMKSHEGLQVNLAGLFVPCFEGFAMMMSTSFSYFTLLCSV